MLKLYAGTMKQQINFDPSRWSFIGGKAQGLLWLRSQGFAVPEFVIIDFTVVLEYLKTTDILLRREQIQKELHKYHLQFPVAVRSSGLQEDSEDHSFAGIYQSFLEISDFDHLVSAVDQVILSSQSELSKAYQKSRGLVAAPPMAIVIQQMVLPQISGVSFGLDIETGNKQAAWVSVTEGLGEKLVSGQVRGDEFVWQDGSLQNRSGSALSEALQVVIAEVAVQTLDLSRRRQRPMDIEWAYDGKKIWYLQARPVTTRIRERVTVSTVFDNSNIQESYCGVTTPLTFTYASVAYAKVYKQLMALMQLSPQEISQSSWSLENMLGLVSGRVYYNINNWYLALLHLPSFGKRKKEMEEMMGLEQPVDFVIGEDLTPLQKMARLPRLLKVMVALSYRFSRMDSLVKDFDQWFWTLYRQADRDGIAFLSEPEIFEKIRVYQDLFLEKWAIPVLNDTKVMMDMGSVKRLLEKHGIQQEIKSLIYGAEVESVRPTLEIHRLSQRFASDENLKHALFQFKGSQLIQVLSVTSPAMCKEVEAYIDIYGDRCIGELKLETLTMRQDSEVLFSLIRSYIESGLHLKTHLFQSHEGSAWPDEIAKLSLFSRKKFSRKLHALKKSIAAREQMRFHRTRNFGLMRSFYLELGRRWQDRSLLEDFRDIFYLTHGEILDIGSGRSVTRDLKKLISFRKDEFSGFQQVKLPSQLRVDFPASQAPVLKKTSSSVQALAWQGLACSQGTVEGEVVFIENPQDVGQIAGKILLAERTDQG